MVPTVITERTRKIRLILRQVIGYVIAGACLVWVFHGVHGERLARELRDIRWLWVGGAVVLDVMSYVCQGARWRFLLRPIGSISIMRATQAIYAGLFTNEIVPLRAGELVRAYLVSRWRTVPFFDVIPSMAVERLFDGIWLAVGIALIAIFVHLPENLVRAADALGAMLLAAVAAFVVLVILKKRLPDRPAADGTRNPFRTLGSIIARVAQGIGSIGTSRYFYLALFISPLIPVCQMVSFWIIMRAYGLHLSLWVGAAVFVIVYFGTAIPNAPSNVGTYQFFAVLGLTLFGVDKTTATGFSMAVFIVLTLPLWVLGLVAIARSGMRLADLRREVAELVSRRKTV
jgi:uncharacterized protein (TIRG00374 family)